MDERIEKAFNEQLNAELYSSYLYLSMSAFFSSINLPGMAEWMRIQAEEELLHAMKFYDFIIQSGGRVVLPVIEEPQHTWDSPLAVFEHQLAHEQKVTGLINDLVDLARECSDYAAEQFLQWFVKEQVEEEANARDLVSKTEMIGDDTAAMFILDRELAGRKHKLAQVSKE